MAKLRAWMRKHFSSKARREKQSTDDENNPPFLPSSRRPITPPTFSAPTFSAPTCLFFQLPYEIRSTILLMAFGERTLHVDIARHLQTSAEDEAKGWQTGPLGPWEWRGCVCHRNTHDLGSIPPSMRYAWCGPWNDSCLKRAYSQYERKNYPKFVEQYKIGIMGFLLSCRQAYTEGIDVLYSTNCITITSEPLLLNLPKCIPHNRLASITSLEMVITAHRIAYPTLAPSFNISHLQPILNTILTHCPKLRSLCVSFIANSRSGHENISDLLLPMLDTFHHSKPLRDMRIELPFGAVWPAYTSNSNSTSSDNHDHPREAPSEGPFKKSLWRCFDGEEPCVRYRSIERYPFPPLNSKLPDQSIESTGYWISEGEQGPPLFMYSCGVSQLLIDST